MRKYLFVSLLIVASFFATYKLTESPPTWYDEGIIIQPAINLSLTGKMAMQVAPGELISPHFISVGYPLLYPIAAAFKYFGVGLLQARLVMFVYLILLVFLFFILAEKIIGFKQAGFATLLLVSFAPLYGNGKNVLGEVPGLFFLFLFLYFLNKIEHNYGKKIYYLLAGVSAGLCVAAKPLFLILLPAILVAILLLRKRIQFHLVPILLAVGSFFVPVVFWLKTQFWDGDVLSDVFGYYSNPYGVQDLFGLIISNLTRFLKELSPAYFLILFLIWVVAIFIRLKEKKLLSLAETVSIVFSVLVLAAYLRTAGWYRYFFAANIIVLLFTPFSISILFDYVQGRFLRLRNWPRAGLLPLLFIGLIAVFQFYQLGFRSWVANYYDSDRTQILNDYFENFRDNRSIFIYDSPEIVIFLPHQNYYQYLEITGSLLIGQEQIPKIAAGIPDFVVIKSGALPATKPLFTHYIISGNIDRYTILQKQGGRL